MHTFKISCAYFVVPVIDPSKPIAQSGRITRIVDLHSHVLELFVATHGRVALVAAPAGELRLLPFRVRIRIAERLEARQTGHLHIAAYRHLLPQLQQGDVVLQVLWVEVLMLDFDL